MTTVLNWTKVRSIRQRYTAGKGSMRSLGLEFHVSNHTIYRIVHNDVWHDPHYTPRLPTSLPLGKARGSGQLDWDKAREIRALYAAGAGSTHTIGREYGVTGMTISRVVRNLLWHDPGYTPPKRKRATR